MGNTRREFLEGALISATVAATAGSVTHARAEAPKKGRRVGPNDQIRVAVLGVRGQGRGHVSSYAGMDDVVVAAICDPDPNVVPAALKAVTDKGKPEPKYVQDLRRIMDDQDIDVVSIATPNHWHALSAIWAMQSGKDVYVEKPVSHNVREGRVMVDTARKERRICQTGTQIRSTKGTQEAIEFVRSGGIGEVRLARGLCYKPRNSIGKMEAGASPDGLDYNLWLGPAPQRPFHQNRFHYNWHWMWDTGNGDLGNQGIHQMDVARWGLGKSTMPNTVIGFGGRLGYEDDGETPNTHVAVLDYGDSQIIFETRGLKTDDYRGARVGNVFHGSNGYVVLTSYSGGAAFDRAGNMLRTFNGGGDHFRNFLGAVRSRKVEDLTADIFEGHLSSALCHLGNISFLVGDSVPLSETPAVLNGNDAALETYQRFVEHLAENGVNPQSSQYRLGRRLQVNGRREDFGRDRAANQHVSREYRKGFEVPQRV
jgi:predicted dehydrogenase